MKLNDQVVSLENAQLLKNLGVEQQSLFYWASYFNFSNKGKGFKRGKDIWKIDMWGSVNGSGPFTGKEVFSAFTAAELGEMLPRRNKYWSDKLPDEKWSNEFWCEIDLTWVGYDENGKMKNGYSINYHGDIGVKLLDEPIRDENLANAMAKLLIYLLENKLYDPQTQKTQTTV